MGEETDEYVTSSSKLRDTIKAYTGFDILNEAGDGYKDLYEIVLGIGKQWKNLGDLEKAALGEALGGKRNARGLFAIFDNLDILEGAYETSVNSAGSAMQEQEHYAESVQYSIDRTKASLEELAHDFLSSDLLKGLIEGANTFLQKVDEIISKLGTVGTVIAGITGASTVRGLFTNEGLVAGGIKALTNRQFGEANQRRSMWGNIRQLIGLDEPVYDVEGAKTAMSANATEEFKDAAAKENTAGASATKTAAIEAETAAMEANTQAIQQNTAAENGDTLSEKAHEIMDDESYQETYANAIDFDDTIKEAGTDAGSEYAQNFTQAQMDMMNDNSFQEIQDLMTENLDDVIDPGQMFESGSNAGEALGEGISENMRKAMMDDDVSDILADQFEDSFDVSQVMDIGENISDALASGVSGTGEVLIDEFQNAGEALRDSEILTRSAIRTATQDAMAESAAVLERTAEPAASGFVAKFTAGLSGIGGKVGAILTSINPVMLAGGAALGILLGKSIYDAYQNYLIKTASTATDNFVDKKELINNYKDRYTELSKQLTDGNLSDAERVQVRQQLIDLQRQLNSELGAEASGIDLVNGKLEEQLAKLGQVTEEQAKQNLDDPAVQKAYEKAASKMTDENTYNLGQIFDASNGSLGRELIDSIKKDLKGVGGKLNEVIDSEGFTKLEFTGDVTQAQKAIEQIDNSLEDFQKKHRGTKEEEYANSIVQNIKESMQFSRNDVEEIIGKYQDNYKSYLEQEFYNDDNIKKANKTLLSDMSKSVNDLNTAIASGDTEQFNAALDKFKELETTSNGKEFEPYKEIFDDITSNIDKAGQSAMEFKDLLDDNGAGKNNPLKDDADEYVKAVEDLKNEGLQAIDLEDLDLHPEKATQGLKKIGEAFDIAFDGTEEDNAKIQTMISTLTELGIISDSVADAIEGKTEDSFDSFRSSIIKDIANIDTLNGAIAESFSGKGLSYSIDESTGKVVGSVAEIKKAYGELMSDAGMDMSTLVENTANGMHLNQKALRALQSQLEAKNKLELNNQLEEAQKNVNDLQSRFSKMDQNQFPERYNKMKGELDAAKERLESARELQAAYEGATSAYQKWVTAQGAGEEGDMYNAIRETAFSRGDELLKQGLVGTNEFRSIAQLFSSEDLSTAPIDKIIEAYQNGSKAVKSFFTEGYEGINKFASDAASKGIEGIKEVYDEAGQLQGYAFENIDVNKIAEAYGVSASTIESIFRRMSDYGIEVQRYGSETSDQMDQINKKAKDAQESLKETTKQYQESTKTISDEMSKYQEGGNVDLFNRPQISTQKLVEAGWDANKVGEGTATVYSSTFSNEDGTIAMNFTPILPDGSVMEPGKFTQYCEEVVAGVRDDDLQLKIGGTFDGEDAIAQADAAAKRIHELQEQYYGLTGKQIDLDFNVEELDTVDEVSAKIEELESLKGSLELDDSQLEDVNTLLDQLKQKKELIQQATDIPVGYSDLETANTAASQLKDRINEISNSKHVTDIDVAIQNDEQVNTLAQQIASLPREAQIEIGVNEENTGSAQAIIQQIQDNPASIKVTPELVKDDLDQEGTIKYSTEITKPLPESELNKKGTITYNSKMGKALNPAQLNKKQTINQTTNVTKNETTNKTLNTTVTGNASQESAKIRNAIAGIPNQKVIVINAIDLATVKIQKVKSEKIKDKIFVVKATDSATAVIENIKGNNIPDKSFNVTANTTTAINAVTRIKNLVDGLRSKEITLTTKHKDINVANGTAHWQGTAGGYYSPKRYGSVGNSFINHYNGTAYARGNWGLKRDEPNALINELGPEIVVLCKLCYHVW